MITGITGGIGAGKSTVSGLLRQLGAITFSADEAARALLYRGSPAAICIEQSFGQDVLTASGDIDRSELARRIFADAEARSALNRIMHPRILRLLWDQIRSAAEDFLPPRVIAVEAPLLFEANMQNWFERIIVVSASEALQLKRLMLKTGLAEQDARARIAAQMPPEQRAAMATYVVPNEGDMQDLTAQVDEVWKKLTS